jgi:MFS family permease
MANDLDKPRAPQTAVRTAIIAVLLASALGPFAVTGPAVVLPGLAADLHASSAGTEWVQNAYNAIFAATVLAAGSLADRIGRRRVLRAGIAVFGLSAALIAVSPDAAVIDVLRGVQGLGSGAVVSAGAAVLAHATSGPRRVRVFGLLGASFGAGTALGPLVAGGLSHLGGCRAVFIVIAAGAAVAFVAARFALESRDPAAARIDLPGMACFGGALLILSVGFVRAGSAGWSDPWALSAFTAAIVLLAAFVVVELRSPHAMFDVRLFRRPAFTAVICLPFSVTFGLVILLVYLPLFLQGGGTSPLQAAVELVPITAPVLLVPLTAPWLTARWPARTVLVAGPAAIAAGAFGLLVMNTGTSPWLTALPLLVFGVGVGLAFSVMDNAAVSTVPVEKAGAAAGMFNTMRIAGESLAVAAAAAVFISLIAARTSAAHAVAAVQGQRVDPAISAVFAGALHIVFIALGLLALAGALITARALRATGEPQTADHRAPAVL